MGFFKSVVHAITKPASVIGGVIGSVTGVGVVTGVVGSLLLDHGSSTSNTNSGITSTVSNEQNIYIPASTITFEGNLFKPNTRLYVYFDGKDVTEYIKPTMTGEEALGDPLISDSAGHIKGEFHVPNTSSIRFTQGKKELRFTDSSKNDESEESTHGSVYYTYSGSVDMTQDQDAGGTQTFKSTADPTVQSFLVLDSGGIYLKAVNLYFLKKDNQYPILFQIREVVEDTVSDLYLTNSNYIIYPDQINISDDGSAVTTINLNSPVYLQEGKEYGIYLVTNAPATYALATCVYGETDTYNNLSTKDPRIGGIMKHLGQSAWLKDTTRGLKFVLHKCAFDTTQKYKLALDNKDTFNKFLENNSLYTTVGTNVITVKDSDHGFNVNDFVTISGLPEDTYYGGINSNYINGVHRIENVNAEGYSFSNVIQNDSEILIPEVASASVFFGYNIITDCSYQYDNIMLNNSEILLSNTRLEYKIKGLSGRSLDGTETPNVFDPEFSEITNKVDYSTAKVKKINSPYNERNLNPGGDKSLQVDITFSTNNENITPVIDVTNTNASLVENVINNQFTGETSSNNGDAIARYITKDISLTSQSNGIHVSFSANVQGNANIRVYYKTLPIDSTGTLDDEPWVEMQLDSDVSKSSNSTTFMPYKYTVYDLPLFKTFKTKLIMTSPDSTKPPLVKVYRAVAFQSVDNE